MAVRIIIGDVRAKLAGLADESVHCVVTSPPYWGLRDYGLSELQMRGRHRKPSGGLAKTPLRCSGWQKKQKKRSAVIIVSF